MTVEDFRHNTPLRVRWAEVGAQGIVFNGHYLLCADVCITEYWRSIGVRYPVDVVDTFGVDFYVVKSTLEYHASARFDDELDLRCRVARLGRSSIRFIIEMYRADQHLVTGGVVYVYAHPATSIATQTSAPIPETLHERILNFEVLKPEVWEQSMTAPESVRPLAGVVVTRWDAVHEEARAIRYDMFIIEQGVPVELRWDEWDDEC